jgi:hypothetical protein
VLGTLGFGMSAPIAVTAKRFACII